MKITIPFEITLEHIDSLIVTALEGGTTWAKLKVDEFKNSLIWKNDENEELFFTEAIAFTLWKNVDFNMNVYDNVSGKLVGVLNRKNLLYGLKKAAQNPQEYDNAFQKLIEENSDANDCDTLFQLCTLRKVVYC
jgi:hypothetical protein